MAEFAAWWRPWLAYLRREPYPALRVRIDYVEGAKPTAVEIDALKEFLADHVDKPAGIAVQFGEPIALAAARASTPQRVATLAALNDTEASTGDAAYMHLLFFEGDRMGASPGWKREPHVDLLPYPALAYINLNEFPRWARSPMPSMVEHEVGHMLGLVSRRALHNGGHCDSPRCLMLRELVAHWSRLFTGATLTDQSKLCDRCESDLRVDRTGPDACTTRFLGSIALRLEDGYFVASLPCAVALAVGRPDASFGQRFARLMRAQLDRGSQATEGTYKFFMRSEDVSDAEALAALGRAAHDPSESVRRIAASQKIGSH